MSAETTTATGQSAGDRTATPTAAAEAKKRLSSPWASLAAVIIATLWTVPTAGLLIS
jgi:alpha-glucoside transport system permease protein